MGLRCVVDGCKGVVGGRAKRFYQDDRLVCPKCETRFIIGVTDDYADDCVAFLLRVGGPDECSRPCVECDKDHHWLNEPMEQDENGLIEDEDGAPLPPTVVVAIGCKHCGAWKEYR